MTLAAVTGQAAVVQPTSSFTAVTAAHEDAEPSPFQRPERRSTAQRLQDAALSAVSDTRPFLFVVMAGAVLVFGASAWLSNEWASNVGAVVTLAAAALAVLPMTRRSSRRVDALAARRRVLASGAVMFALIAIAPWAVGNGPWGSGASGSGEWSGEPWVLAALLTGVALLCAAGLAPMAVLCAGAVLLPLSPALEAFTRRAGAPSTLPLAVACLLASASIALLTFLLHRRWLGTARVRIAHEDRIHELEAARDAAVQADQEKSRFLAIASHDLRQPVHAIGLFAATLEKRLAGSAEEPLVRNLNRAIDGLDRSFNVMLDISRLDAGAIEPRVQQFPLRDLFRRLHMHFAGQAEQKGLGLRFSPGGKSVSSDPQLLERVLGNLVQNAIKYTEDGGIVVVARSTPTHTNVEIWDTGVGIRGADLRKVFDEFYQVGRGERVRAQGLGMGLAIVKRLVRLLGHELTVSSRPGRGTMFRLSIAVGGLPDIQDVTAAADTLPMPILQPRTVLVLDDEEPIREGLCLLLQEWGYDAIAAGSIDEAVAAVDQLDNPPDLILSDLHLGDDVPDGIAGIEAIRRRCGSEVAAMLITGDTSHAEIRRATESGHPVLFKPVQPRKLYDALRGLGS